MRFVLACLNLAVSHVLDVEEKTFDKCFRVCRMHAECIYLYVCRMHIVTLNILLKPFAMKLFKSLHVKIFLQSFSVYFYNL